MQINSENRQDEAFQYNYITPEVFYNMTMILQVWGLLKDCASWYGHKNTEMLCEARPWGASEVIRQCRDIKSGTMSYNFDRFWFMPVWRKVQSSKHEEMRACSLDSVSLQLRNRIYIKQDLTNLLICISKLGKVSNKTSTFFTEVFVSLEKILAISAACQSQW